MTEVRKLIEYYVSVDDVDHMDIVSFHDHIFSALASYYETINIGPDDGESTTRLLQVEIGEIIFTGDENGIDGDEGMESLLYHEFSETD
jgi:hypothetical protein